MNESDSDEFFDAVEELPAETIKEQAHDLTHNFESLEEQIKEESKDNNDFGEDFFFIKGSPRAEKQNRISLLKNEIDRPALNKKNLIELHRRSDEII